MRKRSSQAVICACGNKAREGKTECNTCNKRRWRENNPIMAVYTAKRDDARKRRIGFFITFEEFVKFIVDTEYMLRRGRGKFDLTIDRIKPQLGYRAGNLQILTNQENARKGAKETWGAIRQTKEQAGTPF